MLCSNYNWGQRAVRCLQVTKVLSDRAEISPQAVSFPESLPFPGTSQPLERLEDTAELLVWRFMP